MPDNQNKHRLIVELEMDVEVLGDHDHVKLHKAMLNSVQGLRLAFDRKLEVKEGGGTVFLPVNENVFVSKLLIVEAGT